ncbi:MAG: riboflavin synthase [Nevskiales bacterium]|nr:riboflavin synthase [Nevskiales bacterium]
MFTGIVEALGRITAIEKCGGDRRLTVSAGRGMRGLRHGDSVAVNGICLTVAAVRRQGFVADVSVETLECTTAGHWRVGSRLNLEKALTAGKRMGGHWVSGHVDGVAVLQARRDESRSRRLRFSLPRPLARYLVRKGSVCLDGVSLTVNDAAGTRFGVNIVPYTLRHTTLGRLNPGDGVNLEVDVIARYLERLRTKSP